MLQSKKKNLLYGSTLYMFMRGHIQANKQLPALSISLSPLSIML